MCLFLQAAVGHSWTNPNGSGLSVSLDNASAQASAEAADRDGSARNISVSQCLFAQAFKALAHQPAAALRSKISDRGVLFQVSYANEPGIDMGGLYREALSMYVGVGKEGGLPVLPHCPPGCAHVVG